MVASAFRGGWFGNDFQYRLECGLILRQVFENHISRWEVNPLRPV
jgi:hypothetical protein